jgi:hypothetical protein
MRGWFKLIETIRKTEPASTSIELLKSPLNSSSSRSIENDVLLSISPEPIVIDHGSSNSLNAVSSPPNNHARSTSIPLTNHEEVSSTKKGQLISPVDTRQSRERTFESNSTC